MVSNQLRWVAYSDTGYVRFDLKNIVLDWMFEALKNKAQTRKCVR